MQEFVGGFFQKYNLSATDICQTDGIDIFAVFVEVEVEVVGEYDMVERSAIAVELLFVFLFTVEVGILKVLGFKICYGCLAFENDKVGSAAGLTSWLVDDCMALGQQGFQQVLHCRAIGMFVSLSRSILLIEFYNIRINIILHDHIVLK